MDELRRYNEKDEWIIAKTLEVLPKTQDGLNTSDISKYSVDNGFLCYKHRIVLSLTSQWIHKIMEEYHTTLTAGHQGILKTYHRIKKRFC